MVISRGGRWWGYMNGQQRSVNDQQRCVNEEQRGVNEALNDPGRTKISQVGPHIGL